MKKMRIFMGIMAVILGFGIGCVVTSWNYDHVDVHLNHFDKNRCVVEIHDENLGINGRYTFKLINGKEEPKNHEVYLGELIGHEADYADWAMDFTGLR